jgi:tetrahydromethanopterin S-methyltransferase subunit A
MISKEKIEEIGKRVHLARGLTKEDCAIAVGAMIENEREILDITPLSDAVKNTPVADFKELVEVLKGIDVKNLCEIIKAVRCCEVKQKCALA